MKKILFYRDFIEYIGGHQKVADYYQHRNSSQSITAHISFSKRTRWDEVNPCIDRVNCLHLQSLLMLNPLSFVVESSRAVLIYGKLPNFSGLALYSAVALLIAYLGFVFFRRVRPGFADVL